MMSQVLRSARAAGSPTTGTRCARHGAPRVLARPPCASTSRAASSSTSSAASSSSRIPIEPYVGTNCYYLLNRASASPSNGERGQVTATFDFVKDVGFNVVRTWAFNDGFDPNYNLQYKEGGQIKYNKDLVDGLVWMLDEAAKRGVRLQLTLTNSWRDFGGMQKYVQWAEGTTNDVEPGQFFTNTKARELYRNYLSFIVPKLKGHPGLHSWDLMNEPRSKDGTSCSAISSWISEAAQFIRGLDSQTPVTAGLDGFFGPSTPALNNYQRNPFGNYPGPNCIEGTDFIADVKDLDFACVHLYPSSWDKKPAESASWSVQWVKEHLDVLASPPPGFESVTGMPLVLQEYSLRRVPDWQFPASEANLPERTQMFKDLAKLQLNPQYKDLFAGNMCWMVAVPERKGDNDGFYLFPPPCTLFSAEQNRLNDEQVSVLSDLCKKINKPQPA